MLFKNAMTCEVEQFFKGQGKTAAPSTFIFIKNKSNEHAGELKCRVLFSYARHPMKAIGRQVGRALNVFIAEGQQCMHTFEMLKTSDVKGWVNQTSTVLQQKCIRHPQALKIWELDVREMFPTLPRAQMENGKCIPQTPARGGPVETRMGCLGGDTVARTAHMGGAGPQIHCGGPLGRPEQVHTQVGQVGERVRHVQQCIMG